MATNPRNNPSSATKGGSHALAGKKSNKTIFVPHEFRRRMRARERTELVNDIKFDTGCDIIVRWDNDQITQFEILGSGPALEKAVRQINHWIKNAPTKLKDSSKWARTTTYVEDKWNDKELETMENHRKQLFKGPVPETDAGNALPMMTLHWPEDLMNQSITPRDVYGNKLEALNKLRTQDDVFITLQSADNIEIRGFCISNVEAAVDHLSTMIETVRTDYLNTNPPINIILDDLEGIDVVFREAEPWWPQGFDRIVPYLKAHRMMNESGTFRQESLQPVQLSNIQRSFHSALEAIRRKKGAYDMSIRLGRVVMRSKHAKEEQIGQISHKDRFLKSISDMNRLEVKKWLTDNESGRQILKELMLANDLLEPAKSVFYYGSTPVTLKETRPMFRGTWVFRDPNSFVAAAHGSPRHPGRPTPLAQTPSNKEGLSIPMKHFIVQVDWVEDENGVYEKIPPRFFELDRGKSSPTENMDINLFELGESRAWHFALESLIPLSPTMASPVLTDFAERVRMRPKYDVASGESFAEWHQTQTVQKCLQNCRLDLIYSFGIKDTGYRAEFSAMWYRKNMLPVWDLTLRHCEWATHLAQLKHLQLGHQADWGDSLPTFLPDDGESSYSPTEEDLEFEMKSLHLDKGPDTPRSGIHVLFDKMMQLSAIVSSVTSVSNL